MKGLRYAAPLADGALFVLGVVAGFVRDFSGDFHWHLVLGDYTLRHGALMRHDELSHTFAGQRQWIDSWFSDVLLAAAYRALGYPGCYLLRGLFLGGMLLLLAREARKRGVGVWTAALLPAFMLSELLFRFYLRPETFTFALLAGLLALLGHHERTGSRRALFATLPIVTLWANVHGSVAIALLVLGAYGLVRGVVKLRAGRAQRSEGLLLFALPLLAFVAATLNPDGLRQPLMFLYVTSADPTFGAGIEWRPLSLDSMSGLFPVFLVVVALTSELGRKRISGWQALVVVVLFAVSIWHGRFVKAALVCAVPLVAGNLAVIRERMAGKVDPTRFVWLGRALAGTTTLVLVVFLFGERKLHREVGLGLDPGAYPEKACAFARETKLPKEMLNAFDFGSYLLFCLPERRTYIDQRAATLFTPEFSREYRKLAAERTLLRARTEKYHVSFAFTAFDPIADQLANDPERWSLVYFDDLAQLYLRNGVPSTAGAPPFRWLHPYALSSLTLLTGAPLEAARAELALQKRRCSECRQTRLLEVALAAGDPTFERLLAPLADASQSDVPFLLAVAAFRSSDLDTALALFARLRDRRYDHVAALVWTGRTLDRLGRPRDPRLVGADAVRIVPTFWAEAEAIRELSVGRRP